MTLNTVIRDKKGHYTLTKESKRYNCKYIYSKHKSTYIHKANIKKHKGRD